jgi:hypothetical protein
MTPEEFYSLKTGTADPITPDQLMSHVLRRLKDLQDMKNKGKGVDERIDEVCYLLGVHLKEDGTIEPTHYCG